MPGGDAAPLLRPLSALCLLLALTSCASRRPVGERAPSPAHAPYSAKIQFTAEAKGRGLSVPAGVAVDPAGFARVELRDPMGATLLVLALTPTSGRILSPDLRRGAKWDGASEALPWSPSELWCLLAGVLPTEGASLANLRPKADGATWKGPFGKVTLSREASPGRAFPPAQASLRGPGPARLGVVWRRVYEGAPPESSLAPPPAAPEQLPLESLLKEVFR